MTPADDASDPPLPPPDDPVVARMLALALIDAEDVPAIAHLVAAARANPAMRFDEDDLLGIVQALGRGVDRIATASADIGVRRMEQVEPDARERVLETYLQETYDPTVAAFALMYAHRAVRMARRRAQNLGPGGAEVSVGFVDLRGSTEYMLHHGDAEIAALADELFVVAQGVAAAHDVTAGKFLGDGVLLVAQDGARLLDAALATTVELGRRTALSAGGGVARGRVVRRAGDWHGTPVNLAARLAEHALPGEVLVDAGPPEGDVAPSQRVVDVRGLAHRRLVEVHPAR